MFSVLFFLLFISSWLQLVANEKVANSKPIDRLLKVYFYSVTNSDDFLENGSKPTVKEMGPYVYVGSWEKKNDDGTVVPSEKKTYTFNQTLSIGHEYDVIVVPNIALLMFAALSKNESFFVRYSFSQFFSSLKAKPFITTSVGELLWGYEDPIMAFLQDFKQNSPKPQSLNKSSKVKLSLFPNGSPDFFKYGLTDEVDVTSELRYDSKRCNSSMKSNGSGFPTDLTKNSTIYAYNENFCRIIPLSYENSILEKDNTTSYRYTASRDVLTNLKQFPVNPCFCPKGQPCNSSDGFTMALCQQLLNLPLSFPHFYLSNDSYRTALEGISSPDPEEHKSFIDIEPTTGTAMRVRTRFQFNLAVGPVDGIKQTANFPEMIFPIMWFEEAMDGHSEG